MSFPEASPTSGGSGVPSVRVKPGDVIADKYVVEKVLAAGGMGVVLSAQHRQLKRRVALKFLLPELCATPDIVQRFLREAQAMTAIQNEHVARVLDVGTTADGSPYMVMEYLEGEDLGQTLERRGKLPVSEAVDYVLQGMEALAEAHVNGFVHRDLKPSNLFVTQRPDGTPLVKVLDFGISKAISGKEEAPNLTQTRGMLGSPLYMAPEQIRSSKSVDIRADIWTLGIILHELISGKSPFEGDTESVASVLAAIMSDDPAPLQNVRPDTPQGLSEVVLRCLSRNRDNRYGNVADLATALAPFAPPQSQVSIDRIKSVIAHHQRMSMTPSTPEMLSAKTVPNGVTPVPLTGGSGTTSPLGSTAAADIGSSPTVRPPPSSPDSKGSPTPVSVKDNANRNGSAPTSSPRLSTRQQDPDSTFGKYRLLAVLGQGGMADVFLAVLGGPEGLGFSKLVVIKRLRASLANDREFVSMLVDEARIAAKLNHPNVVQTHEVGVINDEYYIAMEYLEGQPLNQIVQRASDGEPMSLAFKLGIVRDLLAGVDHAHELVDFDGTPLGLVHRDVTPQNVFVTYEGQVKVVDFGIAKARGRATETAQGMLKGKVRYMSPEQASGQNIDRRTDVFAAGVILWELLTGQRMWSGHDDVAIIQKLMLDKIPSSPRAVNPDVPKALDAIVKKALSRKPADRYATAQELHLELDKYMEAEGLKCSHRSLGAWVGALFADRRKQAKGLIEEQLTKLRSPGSASVGVLKLKDSGPFSSPSGQGLQRLDRDPVPDDVSSRRSALSRSDPRHENSSGAYTSPRSRGMMIGGLALVVVTALVIVMLARSRAETKRLSQPVAEPSSVSPPSSAVAGNTSATQPDHAGTGAAGQSSAAVGAAASAAALSSATAAATSATSGKARVGAPTPPAAKSVATANPTTPLPSASGGRKKRELDRDNPYAADPPPP